MMGLPAPDPHYDVKTGLHLAYGSGTADRTPSAGVDCQGFRGVSFLVLLAAVGASSTYSLKLQQSDDDGDQDAYSDIAGSAVTIADTDDDSVIRVTVVEPQKRYVLCFVDKDTSHTDAEAIIYELFGPKSAPVSTAGLSHNLHLVSPSEGTA